MRQIKLTFSQKLFDNFLPFPGRDEFVSGRLLLNLLVELQVDGRDGARLQLLPDLDVQELVLQVDGNALVEFLKRRKRKATNAET